MSGELEKILATAQKTYGFRAGAMSQIADDVKFLTTGNMLLDFAIGGGVPMGRTVEFFGEPSAGKTTASLQTAAALQDVIRSGGDPARGINADDRIIFLDYEQAMDPSYAEALGLDITDETVIFGQPDTLEQGANFVQKAVATGRVRLIIIDSVAAMNPSAKAEAEIGKSLPAVQAKLMKDFGANLNPLLAKHNCTVIFLNHLMEKMDMGMRRPGMPPPTTTPGGKALKYFASCRVEFKQIRNIAEEIENPMTREIEKIPMATDVKAKVVKNKVGPAFRSATLRVRFGEGFDNHWAALGILMAHKKIMYSSGMFYFHNLADEGGAPEWMDRAQTGTKRPYVKGEKNLREAMDAHPEWAEFLVSRARAIVDEAMHLGLRELVVEPPDEDDETEELDEVLGKIAGTEPEGKKFAPLQG